MVTLHEVITFLVSMQISISSLQIFFFNDTATTEIYTLSLRDALPIWCTVVLPKGFTKITSTIDTGLTGSGREGLVSPVRSEEHTSELQSLRHLVCRLLLEKKKNTQDLINFLFRINNFNTKWKDYKKHS